MKRTQLWWGFAAFIGICILILDSKTAVSGAQEGIELCFRSLIPSLFPFFVLTSLLTNAFVGTSIGILHPLSRWFRIPVGCESILIPAFLGGYPAGAQCIGQACAKGWLSEGSAQRMLLFCNNAGPAFLFGVLGSVFPDHRILWVLWGIQILSCALCGWIFRDEAPEEGHIENAVPSLTDSLVSSVRTMGTVCGWVILFRILIAFLDRWVLWIFPKTVQIAIAGLLELSNGCCMLESVPDERIRFLLASGMLSFGGLCVTMQTASTIHTLSIMPYVAGKLLQSLLCLGLSAAMVYHWPLLIPGIILFCWIIKKVVALQRSMVYNGGSNTWRKPYAVS